MSHEELNNKSDHELLILLNERWGVTHGDVDVMGAKLDEMETVVNTLKLRLNMIQTAFLLFVMPVYTLSLGQLVGHLVQKP